MEEEANTSAATIMLMGTPTQHDFKWTHERCMLLLHEYDLLKDKFKDRKHKKKDLWADISLKFKKIYAYDLEWDVAYKKFRNLKQTFEQVRAKLQQQAITGQYSNRPKWPYFEKFQQILDDPVVTSYSYADHHQQQQQQNHLLHHTDEPEDDQHPHHHHHHHHKHMHPLLDPPTTGQVLAGEDFTETLVTVFPMGEDLEIPVQSAEDSEDDTKVDPKDIVVQTAISDGEDAQKDEKHDHIEGDVEEKQEDEPILVQHGDDELEEAPHRKRFRRLSAYEQERLMIEREKLVTLREIQRGIECKNDILRGILHVLQSRVWQAHPAMD
ncbi:uncharacterized protein LOC128304022 [Anopheles moucheti]|uniref:uncharacterized protein LOC128304022 n=1 Tax=Anopheles moucheti TaxID=186751 RepID=UPI0022F0413E|nr:uncharacterized protein LOC128304022 [Anopheles moucheti]